MYQMNAPSPTENSRCKWVERGFNICISLTLQSSLIELCIMPQNDRLFYNNQSIIIVLIYVRL